MRLRICTMPRHDPGACGPCQNTCYIVCLAAHARARRQVEDYFTRLIQRVAPKHDAQARAEVVVTRRFLENFSGDQARWSIKEPPPLQFQVLFYFFLFQLCFWAAINPPAAAECMQADLFSHLLHLPSSSPPLPSVSACMLARQVRFTARSFSVAGDHAGQTSHGHRWPYGPVALITVRSQAHTERGEGTSTNRVAQRC